MMGISRWELLIIGLLCVGPLVGGAILLAVLLTRRRSQPGQEFAQNLIRCPDCGRRISPSAVTCPQCGRPMQPAGE
jgi:hypothetical protein